MKAILQKGESWDDVIMNFLMENIQARASEVSNIQILHFYRIAEFKDFFFLNLFLSSMNMMSLHQQVMGYNKFPKFSVHFFSFYDKKYGIFFQSLYNFIIQEKDENLKTFDEAYSNNDHALLLNKGGKLLNICFLLLCLSFYFDLEYTLVLKLESNVRKICPSIPKCFNYNYVLNLFLSWMNL